MKKRWWLLIVMVSAALIFSGCGGNASQKQGEVGGGDQAPPHAHGDFEWIGEFELAAGEYLLHFGASADETMDIGFIKLGENIVDLEHHGAHLMATEKDFIAQDVTFAAQPDYAYTLEMHPEHGHIHFTLAEAGRYAIVTEHLPEESNMQIFDEADLEILPVKIHAVTGHSD